MRRVSICDSFDSLPRPCEALFREAGAACIFSSLPWFRNFTETVLPADAQLRIYGVGADTPDGPLAVALPMYYEAPRPAKFAPRRLLSLGNYYTPVFGPIVGGAGECTQEDLHSLAGTLAAERPKWDVVDLHPLEDGPLFDRMLAAFRGNGMLAARYFCFGNWYLQVGERCYDEYHATLPSVLRNTIRRKTERLVKSGRLRLEIVTGADGVPAAIAAFEQVYNSSWKTPEPFPRFIPGLIHACAAQGWLRLGIAYVEGVPAAAQLWMVCGGVASIYKLAYDQRFAADSVGSILTSHLMRHVIDVDKVREVDFLSGDDPYKKDWMSHRRERHGIMLFNLRTPYGMLGALRHLGGTLWKRVAVFKAGLRTRRFSDSGAPCDND